MSRGRTARARDPLGAFHLDDALAYAASRLALGLGEPGVDHTPVGTRVDALDAAADVASAERGNAALLRLNSVERRHVMDTEPGRAPDDGDRMRFYSRGKTRPDSSLLPDPSDPDILSGDVLHALLEEMPCHAREALVAACGDKRSSQAVRSAVWAAPNEWRGWVARFFHLRFAEGRGPRRQHRVALGEAWGHDHAAVGAAAGGRCTLRRMFVDAGSSVPVRLGDPVVLWRGYSVDDPLLRRGVSWTTDKREAAWFANWPRPVSPVVLRCVVPHRAILHWSDERGEREAVCFETDGAAVDDDPAEWERLAAEIET